MNIKTFFLCLILSLLAILLPAPAAAPARAEDAHAAVRVGCVQPDIAPELSSVITQQQVAYLTELSKYTDWNLTPVPVTADEAMEKLLTGEIDLVLPVEPHIHATDTFVATQPLALRDLIVLYSRPGEDRFSAEDLRTLDGACVGTLEDRPDVTAPFENFCAENGLSLKLVPYATAAAARTALANGSIDLLIDTATNNRRNETFLLAFDSKPMAIAGPRAKAPLIRDLDAAAAALTRENPLYAADYTRDFLTKTSHLTLHFSPEETALIESLPPLRVVLPETLQTKDIVRELIETAAKDSGLRVTLLSAADVEAARRKGSAEEVLVHLVERLRGNPRLDVVEPVCVEKGPPRAVLQRQGLRRPYKRAARLVHVRELGKLVVVVDEHVLDRQVGYVERHLVLERHEAEVVEGVREELLREKLGASELRGEGRADDVLSFAALDVLANLRKRVLRRLRKASKPADVRADV